MLIGEEVRSTEKGRPCPVCGQPAHTTYRKALDRTVSIVVPVRRWKCYHCGWTGLQTSRRGMRRRREWLRTYGWLVFAAALLLVVLGGALWLIKGLFGPKIP